MFEVVQILKDKDRKRTEREQRRELMGLIIKKMSAVLDESMYVSDEDLKAVLSPRHATHLLLSVCLKKKE